MQTTESITVPKEAWKSVMHHVTNILSQISLSWTLGELSRDYVSGKKAEILDMLDDISEKMKEEGYQEDCFALCRLFMVIEASDLTDEAIVTDIYTMMNMFMLASMERGKQCR